MRPERCMTLNPLAKLIFDWGISKDVQLSFRETLDRETFIREAFNRETFESKTFLSILKRWTLLS